LIVDGQEGEQDRYSRFAEFRNQNAKRTSSNAIQAGPDRQIQPQLLAIFFSLQGFFIITRAKEAAATTSKADNTDSSHFPKADPGHDDVMRYTREKQEPRTPPRSTKETKKIR